MLRLLISVSGALLFFVSAAHADVCANTRLDGLFQPLFLEKQRNQVSNGKDTSLCYAIVATQMFDAQRRKKGIVLDDSSVVATAIEYMEFTGAETPESGNVQMALEALRKYGSCSEHLVGEDRFDLLKTEENVENRARYVACPEDRDLLSPEQRKNLKDILGAAATVYEVELSAEASNLSKNDVRKGKRLISGLSMLCPNSSRRHITFPHPSSTKPRDVGIIASGNIIDKALKAKNPVGISVDYNLFDQGHGSSFAANHAAMIIGSRDRGGTCEYLVRNSYKPDCSHIPRGFSCTFGGDLWIPRAKVIHASDKITWLPPEK